MFLDSRSLNATVDGNLAIGLFRATDESPKLARNRAAFYLDVEPRSLRGNVAGGMYDTGFTLRPTLCRAPFASDTLVGGGADSDPIEDNEAFASKIGFFVLSTTGRSQDKCVVLRNALAWKAAHIGVLTVDQLAHFRLDNVTVADSHIGFSANYRRGPGVSTSYTVVENSRFVGMSAASTCDASVECRAVGKHDAWGSACHSVLGSSFMRAGILTAQYLNRGKTCTHDEEAPVCRPPNTPTRMCGMPWEHRYGLPSARHAEYHVINSNFVGFGNGTISCGGQSYGSKAVVSNPSQVDFFPPMKLQGMDWTGTEHEAKFHFFKRERVTDEKCIKQGCDSFSQVLVTDMDGSTVSSGRAGAHILSGWDPGHAVDAPECVGVAAWRGIECGNIGSGASSGSSRHRLVAASFDNLDRDRGFRLLHPVQVQRSSSSSSSTSSATQLRNTSSVGPIADTCPMRFPFG